MAHSAGLFNMFKSIVYRFNYCSITNREFIGGLYNLGVVPEIIVWSFINGLLAEYVRELQIRCLCAVLKLVAPKLFKTYSVTRAMSLKLKKSIDKIKEMYLNNWIHESTDVLAEERRTVENNRSFESLDYNLQPEPMHSDSKITNETHLEECRDIEYLLTPAFISLSQLDQVANETEKIRTADDRLLTDLVMTGRLTKFSIIKEFHIIFHDKAVNEQLFTNKPDLLPRNEFENRLIPDKPVIELLNGDNRSFKFFDNNSKLEFINVEFSELLLEFANKSNSNKRHDIERRLTAALNSLSRSGQVNAAVSINYAALHNDNENIRTNAGRLLADLVLKGWLTKLSVVKGFYKILQDDAANERFTNVPDLLATIRTEFENQLYIREFSPVQTNNNQLYT